MSSFSFSSNSHPDPHPFSGHAKPRSLQRIFERVQRINNVRIQDSNSGVRDVWIRYVRDHHIENNDWGDFQTHRRLLGLITVGAFETQPELGELCRVHESLKVKYNASLFDSRCLAFGPDYVQPQQPELVEGVATTAAGSDRKPPPSDVISISEQSDSIPSSNGYDRHEGKAMQLGLPMTSELLQQTFTPPSNFKSTAFFYPEHDPCPDLEANITEFISALFWILESKRLQMAREKIDKVSLLLAPFEKKDFVGECIQIYA